MFIIILLLWCMFELVFGSINDFGIFNNWLNVLFKFGGVMDNIILIF